MRADFRILDHGSIVLLEPISDAGREWVDEHIPEEGHWGVFVAAERRYVQDIIDGIVSDGLEILGINDQGVRGARSTRGRVVAAVHPQQEAAMIQLPPMEESEVLAILVAVETLHQGLTNDITLHTGNQALNELVTVSKRLRALMGVKRSVLISEARRRVGPNMASAMDALCALLVKRLQRMPRQAELAGRVAAEIKQLEEMWRAPERLDRKEHSA